MKKAIVLGILASVAVAAFALGVGGACGNAENDKPQETDKVIAMNKEMFVQHVYDYEAGGDWKYKGDKPAIIDLYATWCGPCMTVAPIMKKLAKEYDGKIVIYKVNVDKERELSALFNATSIPLFVFIPMQGQPRLFRGAADKATYQKMIDEFLLNGK